MAKVTTNLVKECVVVIITDVHNNTTAKVFSEKMQGIAYFHAKVHEMRRWAETEIVSLTHFRFHREDEMTQTEYVSSIQMIGGEVCEYEDYPEEDCEIGER